MKKLLLILALLSPSTFLQAAESLHVHIISGSEEYRSEASLKPLAEILEKKHGIQVTTSWVKDGAESLPVFEKIPDADVPLVFARRLKLPDEEMALIRAHWEAGKGIVGIRTSSHAFGKADNKTFDRKVMGGNYDGHFGDEKVSVSITDAGGKHVVMAGVGEIESRKLYKAGKLGDGVVVLQNGAIGKGKDRNLTHPVTWLNTYKGGNMFYTSLGVPTDFEDPDFVRMLVNAIHWVGGRSTP